MYRNKWEIDPKARKTPGYVSSLILWTRGNKTWISPASAPRTAAALIVHSLQTGLYALHHRDGTVTPHQHKRAAVEAAHTAARKFLRW